MAQSPQPPSAWPGRATHWLQSAAYVVGVNLLMLAGTIAGLVVLGIFPALTAGSALLARLAAGDPSERPWSDFWTGWRSQFARSNLLGLPAWLAAAFLLVDANLLAEADDVGAANEVVAQVVSVAVAVFGLYLLVALAFLFPAARRYTDSLRPTWRFVLAAPVLAPVTALAVAVVLLVLAVGFATFPALLPVVGLSLPLLATGWLVDLALDRIDARAVDDGSPGAPVLDDARSNGPENDGDSDSDD